MEKNPEKFSSGFTILELLIVISIISIISAFSFFHLLNWQTSFLVKIAAQRIASELRLAKIEALKTGDITKITFDSARDILIYRGSKSRIVNFPRGVDLYNTNFDNNTISFYSTGTPSMGGTITIQVRKKLMYLTVTPVTGRVRINE
jgi:prepilin-type N-terminal cleavage/methylation domain-containing protein